MVTLSTIEGLIDNVLWFHYDAAGDVLYLRLENSRRTEAFGEETDDGLIVLSDPQTGARVGVTVVNWWKRFGHGVLPDSISEFRRRIEPFAGGLAA